MPSRLRALLSPHTEAGAAGKSLPKAAQTASINAEKCATESSKVASKGSTATLSKGTTLPRTIREQMAAAQVKASPASGSQLPIKMTDPRWPASDGWVKMQQMVNSGGGEGPINVHYVMNTITGAIDDIKIVVPGAR